MTTRAASAAATRERIMRAMYELFIEHDYEDVTLQAIAEAANVTVQTILVHFGSKDAVFVSAIGWWKPQEDQLREVPEGDVDEAARIICARYEHQGEATLRFLAAEKRIPAIQALTKVGRASHRAWVEKTFGAVIKATGKTRARRIMQLVAAYDVYTWHVLRRELDEEDTVRAIAELARAVLEMKNQKGGPR
jgi:AcrR family transcriptional regulator